MTRIAFCAKSTWDPAIRREHELARLAAEAGHDVVFVERPRDVRTLTASGRLAWAGELARPRIRNQGTVVTARRSTFVPAHRGAVAARVDSFLLSQVLADLNRPVIVSTVPWEWPAVSRCTGARRVFDCADDWSQILPGRGDWIRSLFRRIADEADAVVCATAHLAGLFAPRRAVVVPNGTPATLLAAKPTPPPRTSTMVYSGTLSERFDVKLVDTLLSELPEWRLDLYGPCQYAGRRGDPDAELSALLGRWPSRAAWHGPVTREHLARVLDAGDVLVIPHQRRGAVDGDWMKLYDYTARGRPVVTTPSTDTLSAMLPPHTHVAATSAEFAAAVHEASDEPPEFASTRRRWAEANSWQTRWAPWSAAVFG